MKLGNVAILELTPEAREATIVDLSEFRRPGGVSE